MVTVSNPVRIGMSLVLCGGAAYLASQVKGDDTKAAMMQGAYMGVAVSQGQEFVKAISSTPAISDRLNPDTTYGKFMQKTQGLSGAEGAVNGYFDNENNYHEEGLNGYIDTDGNLNAYAQLGSGDEALNGGYYDENGNFVSDGLSGYELEEDGLHAYEDEEGVYAYEDEDGLNAYDYEEA